MTRRRRRAHLAGLLLILGVLLAVGLGVPVPEQAPVRAWFADLGLWAGPVFAVAYVGVTLSPLPKAVFTIAAGALFGLLPGVIVVVIAATGGAVVAFYLARLLGHGAAAKLTNGRGQRLGERLARDGLWAVLVARVVPVVPFTAVNYLAGLTALRVWHFVAGTALGILPATTAYVVIGAYGTRIGSWPVLSATAAVIALAAVATLATRWRRHQPVAAPPTEPVAVTARRAGEANAEHQ